MRVKESLTQTTSGCSPERYTRVHEPLLVVNRFHFRGYIHTNVNWKFYYLIICNIQFVYVTSAIMKRFNLYNVKKM